MVLKRVYVVALAVVAIGVTTVVVTRLLTTDRERVARTVRKLAARLEKRDAAGFCLLLPEDYRDSRGHNRPALRSRLSAGLLQLGSLTIRLEDVQITLEDGQATVEFLASWVARARDHGRRPPWRDKARVRLRLSKREGKWRVCEAEYALPPIARF